MRKRSGVAPRRSFLRTGLWERRFASDPHIIGRSITLNDKSTRIVGVLPAWFDFSTIFTPGSRVDMLIPFPITPETDRYGNTLSVLGRLKPGVSVQTAQAEFDVINDLASGARTRTAGNSALKIHCASGSI